MGLPELEAMGLPELEAMGQRRLRPLSRRPSPPGLPPPRGKQPLLSLRNVWEAERESTCLCTLSPIPFERDCVAHSVGAGKTATVLHCFPKLAMGTQICIGLEMLLERIG